MATPATFRKLAEGSNAGPSVGDLAPSFELRQTFERNVALSDLIQRGGAAIFFYVFDFGHV